MAQETLFAGTIIFSLVTGTAAGVLALLNFEVFRRSPFGQATFVLSLAMVLFIVYHASLLLVPELPVVINVVKSAVFTSAAVFIWVMAWSQRQVKQRATSEVDAS